MHRAAGLVDGGVNSGFPRLRCRAPPTDRCFCLLTSHLILTRLVHLFVWSAIMLVRLALFGVSFSRKKHLVEYAIPPHQGQQLRLSASHVGVIKSFEGDGAGRSE